MVLFKGYSCRYGFIPDFHKLGNGMCFNGLLTIGDEWYSENQPFQGKKGIIKGVTMSPYLFLLAIEYLQRELVVAIRDKSFTSIRCFAKRR